MRGPAGKKKKRKAKGEVGMCKPCVFFKQKAAVIEELGLKWGEFKPSMVQNPEYQKRAHTYDKYCNAQEADRKTGPPKKNREVEGCPACSGGNNHKAHTCGLKGRGSIDLDDKANPLLRKGAPQEEEEEGKVKRETGSRSAKRASGAARPSQKDEKVRPPTPALPTPPGCPGWCVCHAARVVSAGSQEGGEGAEGRKR